MKQEAKGDVASRTESKNKLSNFSNFKSVMR